MRLTVILLLLTGLFINLQSAYAQISNPDGELQKTTAYDIWVKTMAGSHYNEFWNYQFYFDNGIKLHIVFSVANFGRLKSPVSGVRVSILNLDDKKTYQLSREYPVENLLQDKENHLFSLNPRQENVWFKGKLPDSLEIYINTAKDGERFHVHLHLDEIQQGYKWDNGMFTVDNEKIGIITHIPHARVTGEVGINENIQQVTGTGYMDHTFQNQTTTQLMNSGYRYVHHGDNGDWDVMYFMIPRNHYGMQTIGYRMHSDGNEVNLQGVSSIVDFVDGRAFREDVPQRLGLFMDDETIIYLNRVIDEERFSVLGQLSWIARRAARAFLGGDVIDIRGQAALEIDNTMKNGEYNFFFVD